MNKQICSHCGKEFNVVSRFPLSYSMLSSWFTRCGNCGATVAAEVDVELPDEALDRHCICNNAALECMKVITENNDLEVEADKLEKITSAVIGIVNSNTRITGGEIYYPRIVTESDGSRVIEYYV